MFTSITIDRFRGIPSLTIEDLGRVNILIGPNGVGKTTVLESILLSSNPTGPGVLTNLAAWREFPPPTLHNEESLVSLFYDRDITKGPSFSFTFDGKRQKLELRATYGPTSEASSTQLSQSSTATVTELLSVTPSLTGLEWSFKPNPDEQIISVLSLHATGMQFRVDKQFDSPPCFYIHGRRSSSIAETGNLLTRLYQIKRADLFVTAVQAVDPRVRGFQPGIYGNAPVVLVDIGLETLIPLNVAGDGFCRAALIATGIFFPNIRTVAVDEIDSGLHTSVMTRVWEAIAANVVAENKQLFCTTHSEEMLRTTLAAFKDSPELLRIFRLDRLKDGSVAATKYNYERLENAEFADVDIR